jgi:hypothetical protein
MEKWKYFWEKRAKIERIGGLPTVRSRVSIVGEHSANRNETKK